MSIKIIWDGRNALRCRFSLVMSPIKRYFGHLSLYEAAMANCPVVQWWLSQKKLTKWANKRQKKCGIHPDHCLRAHGDRGHILPQEFYGDNYRINRLSWPSQCGWIPLITRDSFPLKLLVYFSLRTLTRWVFNWLGKQLTKSITAKEET